MRKLGGKVLKSGAEVGKSLQKLVRSEQKFAKMGTFWGCLIFKPARIVPFDRLRVNSSRRSWKKVN